jgi:hypothetical protein
MPTSKINLLEQVRGYVIGTKAAVEATTGLSEGSIGYATDTNELGSYDGSAWTWGQGVITDLNIPETFRLSGDITPSALSGDVNDYNPTGWADASVIRLSTTGAPRTITGLTGGTDGRVAILLNTDTTYYITLANEHASSTAGNRFAIGSNFPIPPNRGAKLIYDSTTARWRMMLIHEHANLIGTGAYTHTNIDNHINDIANPHAVTAAQAGAIPTDGWEARSETWTRTGNHTFTVSGDLTAVFRKGAKIRYKDGGAFEHGVVGLSAHVAGTTTITLITNSDYAMAAATITDKYISYVESPDGFPDWFNFAAAPGASQYSANPTNTVYRWRAAGRSLHYIWREATNGTSNGTANTLTLPVAAATITNAAWEGSHSYIDNGAAAANVGVSQVASGGTVVTLFTATASGAWTNANGKRSGNGFVTYEF